MSLTYKSIFIEAFQSLPETDDFQPDEVRRSERRTLVHHHMDWGIVKADLVKRTGLTRQETRLAPKHHAFLINLHGEARTGEDFIEGKRITFTPRHRGSIVFVPARSEWTGWDEGDRTGSYLLVTIDSTFIARSLGCEHLSGLKPIIGFRDTTIEASLHRIGSELLSPDDVSILMVKSQAIQLFVRLVRMHLLDLGPARGGLSAFDLKRVVAIMEARLADPLGLDELAKEIGLSERHFFRAFKQSTGKTPHAYLVAQRVEHAAELLRNTEMSATDIAFESGFSSSSHLTRSFKKAFGTGPLDYRRYWRQ